MKKLLSRTSIDELIQSAESLTQSGASAKVITLYRDWIRHNPKSTVLFIAHFNLGYALSRSEQLTEALASYQTALRYKPNFFNAQLNAGVILEKLGRIDEAINIWRAAIQNEQNANGTETLIIAYNNLGRLLDITRNWSEALRVLTRSLELMPNQDKVLYHWVRLRQQVCAWPIHTPLPHITPEMMMAQSSAIAMLSISDDPALQRKASQNNVLTPLKNGPLPQRLSPQSGYGHQRLRVGYLSSNFNFHPVSLIAVELFELHDRSRVEVFGFSWSPADGSPMHARVRKAMDHYIPIHNLSNEEAARLIASHEIDVLMDLQGMTTGARIGILAYRPAPFQINYLGHPGTACVPGVDYIMVDRYVIPEDERQHYSEQVIYLPDCLQTSDRQRPHPTVSAADRPRYGLSQNGFVYCCFNNTNKFTPETFACWMRILQRVPDSCLWLLADNPAAEANLRQYARDHNVDPARLVFAGRVDYIDFLARFGVADLFLDTFPCTGGTTINDALWMDLPIVTRPGRSFASRLSGSILSALGLSNYITDSVATYEELAVRLAQQPSLLQAYRQELQANKTTQALFDMPRLVHHIEDALEQLVRSSPQPQNQASEAAPGTPEPHKVTRISVILTTHNDADWIEHVVHSIHKETGDDVQLIVVCDMHNSAIQQRVGALLRGQDLYLQRCAMPGLEASRMLGQQLAGSTPTMVLHEGGALTPEFLTALQPS